MVVHPDAVSVVEGHVERRAVDGVVDDRAITWSRDIGPAVMLDDAVGDCGGDMRPVREDLRPEAHSADHPLCRQRVVGDGIPGSGPPEHLVHSRRRGPFV